MEDGDADHFTEIVALLSTDVIDSLTIIPAGPINVSPFKTNPSKLKYDVSAISGCSLPGLSVILYVFLGSVSEILTTLFSSFLASSIVLYHPTPTL